MKHRPERTCIGCRGVFGKDRVVRFVAGPDGIVMDYREKLPGRAVYICPRRACIEQALNRNSLSRGLRAPVKPPDIEEFISRVAEGAASKLRSLIAISAKAGKLAAGYSAVHDAQEKQGVEMLLFAADVSDGTREKVERASPAALRRATFFTRDELGRILNRELVGVVAFLDTGLADAAWNEAERLKSLINNDR